MKKFIGDFVRRGLVACGFGPLVLAVLYWILGRSGVIDALSPEQVCTGILSLTALAFLTGGMNALYQLERLRLMVAILIHGSVLYVGYLGTYLLNSWLDWGAVPVLAFTGIFVAGYLVIWAVIYAIIRRNTAKLNESLKKRQKNGQ